MNAFFCLLFLACLASALCTPKKCKENEVFQECGACDATCENQEPNCPPVCLSPKCNCKPNHVRDNFDRCILADDCPLNDDICARTDCSTGLICVADPVKCKKPPCPKKARCVVPKAL
ncbi:hypothetical protein L596_013894 [Steinernema carpocapsae]|uniref:TIL domain-containing protein n=1 Tax=Steinernema carpocapsae TaxID=34508 RepID=A0A4U5P2V7_STECR|nr:hypothetical protein L596_013894 [Steinernema carpocapsae]